MGSWGVSGLLRLVPLLDGVGVLELGAVDLVGVTPGTGNLIPVGRLGGGVPGGGVGAFPRNILIFVLVDSWD